MSPADERFIGGWDLYAGPLHSLLALSGDGSYVHSLWDGYRRHWGRWAVETQNGTPFLVLHLADAFPRVEPGPTGPQTVAWPSWEAWQILTFGDEQVTLRDCLMVRRHDTAPPPAAPTYAPPPPLAPGPGFPAAPRFPAPSAAPSPASPPGTVAPVPTVVQQWHDQHATWNAVRTIAAQTWADDMAATRKIDDLNAAQTLAEMTSIQTNMQARSDMVHAGAQAMIASLRR